MSTTRTHHSTPVPAEAGPTASYLPAGNEVEVFRAAALNGLPIMLKGPTGCGKTRLVEHMAAELGRPLYTVSCHEDVTASDLLGRFLIVGGDTTWVDGPLTRAVREGGICYLDEIVEARPDAVVAIHAVTDHRRELSLERLGGTTVKAAEGFQLVVSYNPGYQSVLKDMKPSTRQRMVGIELDFPSIELERRIVEQEAGAVPRLEDLLRLAQMIRRLPQADLREAASTRTVVAAACLLRAGLDFATAADAAMAAPLSDDPLLRESLREIIRGFAV